MSLAGGTAERKRIIFHIDFDYFFAQCEEIRNPALKGRPVVVCVYSARGGDSGAVSTANYKAREFGVKSGIPIKFAKDRLNNIPEAVFLPVDHGYYEEFSNKAMSILRRYAEKLEVAGIDEAFMEVTEKVGGDFARAKELASELKGALRQEMKLSVSVGVGPNKLVAKIASDFQKPDGLTVVRPEDVKPFLAGLAVGKIIGVGKKTAERLGEMNVKTIGDLEKVEVYTLTKEFGRKIGTYLYNAGRGVDEEPVVESESVKEISRITTLKKNTNLPEEMLGDLESLCADVHKTLIEQGFSFRSVGIMLVLDDLSIKTKSRSLKSPSTSRDQLASTAKVLLGEALAETGLLVRRLGVKVSELVSSRGQVTLSGFMNEEQT